MKQANWKPLAMRLVVIFAVITLGAVGVAALLVYPLALFMGAMAGDDPNASAGLTYAIAISFVLAPLLVAGSRVWAIWRSIRNPNSAVFIAGVIVIVIVMAVFHAPLLGLSAWLTGGSHGGAGTSRLELRSQ
jgi:Kef-type K+ transport system membrane component KefB